MKVVPRKLYGMTHLLQDGVTPLWLACKFGNVALVKVLLQHQVDINSQTDKVSMDIVRWALKVCMCDNH